MATGGAAGDGTASRGALRHELPRGVQCYAQGGDDRQARLSGLAQEKLPNELSLDETSRYEIPRTRRLVGEEEEARNAIDV